MAKQREEDGLRDVWNSLFDATEFSTCKENDAELQGVSMLVKKMFHVFEKLKVRCEEAESAQRSPCHRCESLEKVLAAYKVKLQQTESRMKSIAQILNMGGGLSQDGNASPGKQQSMAKALTQMLFGDEMEISDDESEPEQRGAKRKRCGPVTPIKVNVIPHKRSPIKEAPKRGNIIAPESAPLLGERNGVERRDVVLESLCSQMAAPNDVVFLSDNDETYLEPPVPPQVTPTRRNAAPPSQGKSSPVIRSKTSTNTSRLNLDRQIANRNSESTNRDDGNHSFTSSPPLSSSAGSKKSPFTPKLRVTKDKTNLGSPCNSATPSGILEALVSAPDIYGSDKVNAASKETTPGDIFRTSSNVGDGDKANLAPVSKNSTPSGFAQSLLSTPELMGEGDETFVSPSLLHGMNPLSKSAFRTHRLHTKVALNPNSSKTGPSAAASDFGQIKSSGNAEVDNILDIICDTKVRTKTGEAANRPNSSTSKRNEENIPDSSVHRKQADFWKLKPSLTSKEPISLGNGQKLKQTKIAFGVHPERTDVCTLKEFNGGIRQSQSIPSLECDQFTLREFNGGIRPGQTSTMLPLEMMPEYVDDAAFERAILDSLKDTNTQYVPDHEDDDDFVLPSPDLSVSKRFVSSQRPKQTTSNVINLKENEEKPPDTQDLLDEIGAPNLSLRTTDLIRGFDHVPKRHEDVPTYKYQRDAVRKRDERMKMEGWDCAECKNYYASRVTSSAERKQLMNKCSKHRDKYRRNDTPPGYWNPEFPSTPELRARNLDITQKPVKFRTRKRR